MVKILIDGREIMVGFGKSQFVVVGQAHLVILCFKGIRVGVVALAKSKLIAGFMLLRVMLLLLVVMVMAKNEAAPIVRMAQAKAVVVGSVSKTEDVMVKAKGMPLAEA